MDEKQRDNFKKALDHLQKRPRMYFSSDAPAVANWLEGFKFAFLLLTPAPDFYEIFNEVVAARGWEHSPQAVWGQMQERGWDEDAINAEMLAIYNEVLERVLAQTELEPAQRKLNGKA